MSARAWVFGAFVLFFAFVGACEGGSGAPKQVPITWEVAREMPGHVAHLGKTTKVDGVERVVECKDCHSVQDAGFASPGSAPCARCHAPQEKVHHLGNGDKPTSCTTCHVFRPTSTGAKTAPICLDCHKQPQGKLAALPRHVAGEVACGACHSPHVEPTTALGPCTSCHTGLALSHGVTIPAGDAGPSDATTTLTLSGIHEARKGAVPAAPFVSLDGGTAEAGTVQAACSTCHAPHQPAADAKGGCPACHVGKRAPSGGAAILALAGKAPKIVPEGAPAQHVCTTCHVPHANKKDRLKACADCHADHKGVADIKAHGACLTCHAPHSPKGAVAACTKCHTGAQALAAASTPKHANCASCHNPHAPKQSPAAACEKCHVGIHATASGKGAGAKAWSAAAPEKRVCVGCHKAHPTSVTSKVLECANCHTKVGAKLVASDTQFHAGQACANCHDKTAIHLAVPPPKGDACAKCHDTPTKQVAKGHTACLSCHGDAHTPTKSVACGGCHDKQQASAPKGHTDCRSCHDSHSGARVLRNGAGKATTTPATCQTCHANKSKSSHGSLPGGCTTCHRPHGPTGIAKPPACATCHTAAKLPGLHATKGHGGACATCHTGGHAPPSSTRETCTGSCHVDKKAHQPDAKVCKGCHVFRK